MIMMTYSIYDANVLITVLSQNRKTYLPHDKNYLSFLSPENVSLETLTKMYGRKRLV